MAGSMRFDVFGTTIEVVNLEGAWKVFYPGQEGKKRLAEDIVIPSDIGETQLEQYLADIRHEYATRENSEVHRID